MSNKPTGRGGKLGPCRIERMASGNLTLILREGEWEAFDTFADDFLRQVGGAVISRADSPVERVWSVRIRGEDFWLAFDDWHHHYELSARSERGNAIVTALAAELGEP
jgi:hypothetical protein